MALRLARASDRTTVRDADLVPDGDPDVTYTLRPVTAQVAGRIRAKAGRSQEEVIYALLDHCLEAWSGVEIDGTPAPCDREHKLMLPLVVASALVDRAASAFETQEAAKRESFRVA